MQLGEAFDRVLVVPDGQGLAGAGLLERLELCAQGVLLVTAGMASTVHQHVDQLIEQADACRWSALYVGHELERGEDPQDSCELVRCAIPPTSVTALALRPELLQRVLATMPCGAAARDLSATDWLTMAGWMLLDLAPPGSVWGAYPGVQPATRPAPALG